MQNQFTATNDIDGADIVENVQFRNVMPDLIRRVMPDLRILPRTTMRGASSRILIRKMLDSGSSPE